jgi:hypothetical protein
MTPLVSAGRSGSGDMRRTRKSDGNQMEFESYARAASRFGRDFAGKARAEARVLLRNR